MPSNYPTSLDSLNNPTASDNLDTPGVLHDEQHTNANDAIEAIEGYVGVRGSTDTNTVTGKLNDHIANHPSGGGGGAAVLPLDKAPSTPHAKDDEFNGTALDAKWTNPATSTRTLTLTVADGWLQFEPSEAGGNSIGSRGGCGIRQPAPTGSFTVSARIADGRPELGNDDGIVGIFVASTSAGVGHLIGSNAANGRYADIRAFPYSETADWGASSWETNKTELTPPYTGLWYRIKYDAAAGTLSFYYSTNGVFWRKAAERTGQSQPDRIGIAMYSPLGDLRADHGLGCDWFRVTEP